MLTTHTPACAPTRARRELGPACAGSRLRCAAAVRRRTPAAAIVAASTPSSAPAASEAAGGKESFPQFLGDGVLELQEPAAVAAARSYQRVPVTWTPPAGGAARTSATAFVPPAAAPASSELPPLLLLHGFDSNSLEFRRLLPLLARAGAAAYAVDSLGAGFTDTGLPADAAITPADRSAHLAAFVRSQVQGQKVVVVGASLGGAAAIDFALAHPELVTGLVLVDAQALIEGTGMEGLPPPLASLGVQFLGTWPLRSLVNWVAYEDRATYATDDAIRVARLHTLRPEWLGDTLSFMRGGGFAVARRLGQLTQPALVLWGANDKILEPATASKLVAALPRARLEWVQACGHVPHLEQAQTTADLIIDWLRSGYRVDASVAAGAAA